MSKNNQTYFYVNFTFRTEEIDFYSILIGTKTSSYGLFNKYPTYESKYNEKCDKFIDEYLFTSRTYLIEVENIESSNRKFRFQLKTNKGIIYETDLKIFDLNNVNVYYNVKFKSNYSDKIFKDPPIIKQMSQLYQYCQVMNFCNILTYHPVLNARIQKITNNVYVSLLRNITKEEKIEDVIKLGILMKKHLEPDKAEEFFKKIDFMLLDFSKVPLNIENIIIEDFVKQLIKEINENSNEYLSSKENKLFFALNFALLHDNYK